LIGTIQHFGSWKLYQTKAAARSLNDAIARQKFPTFTNYYDAFRRDMREPEWHRVGDILASDKLACPEFPIRDSKNIKPVTLPECGSMVETGAAVALLHAGAKNSIVPLHFDWDHQSVFHYVIEGAKRFYVFPTTASWLVEPIINTSALDFARFSHHDKATLIEKLGGTMVEINAGDGLIFPSCYWHCADYVSSSLAISFRYGGDERLRPFAVLPRSWRLQRLLMLLLDLEHSDFNQIANKIFTAFFDPELNWRDRYWAMNFCYAETILELGYEGIGGRLLRGENFEWELILADDEIKNMYEIEEDKLADDKQASQKAANTLQYLFRSEQLDVNYELKQKLVDYACQKRQGLEPLTGCVEYKTEVK